MTLALLFRHRGRSILTIAVLAMLGLHQPATANTPVCTTADVDTDGDGWGWENNQSCVVALVANGDRLPACTRLDSDSDGDGYGWENNQSCVLTVHRASPTQRRVHPTCTSTGSDTDGDGWGWENGRSCRFTNNPTDATAAGPNHPSCEQRNSDPDGDGWGWENNRSCRVDESTDNGAIEHSPSDRNGTDNEAFEESAPRHPVATASGLPACLSTASDPYASGYGFEFGRSCEVLAGVSRTADDPLFNTEFCDSWAELAYGSLRIQNNTWNNSAVYSDQWSQCIELQQNSRGAPVPVWRFNWLDRNSGDQAQVKSYPQV